MKRSAPIARGTSQLKRIGFKRPSPPRFRVATFSVQPRKPTERKRWRPSRAGARFWRDRRAEVIELDNGRCRACGQQGNDVAHVQALGMGRSRFDALDALNSVSNLRLLCRACHSAEEAGLTPRPRRTA